MLRTVTPTDPVPVPNLVAVIVGTPDAGKTTLAHSHSGPLFDFDRGAHRADGRRATVLQMDTWADVEGAIAALASGPGATIDTLERAVTLLKQQLLRDNPTSGADGELYPRGHAILRRRLADAIARWRQAGPLLILAHAKEERSDRGVVKIRMDLPAGVRAEIEKVADIVGYLSRVNGRRVLAFDPPGFEGKNPAQWTPIDVPPVDGLGTFMADLFATGRAALEARNAESARVATVVEQWRVELLTYASVDPFNLALARFRALKVGDPASYDKVYDRFRAAARARGLKFDVEADHFVAGDGFQEPSQSSENRPARVATVQPALRERAS